MTAAPRRWRRLLIAFGLLLGAAAADAATISGIVTDSTGSAIPGARVVLRDIATGVEQETATGANGSYRFETAGAGTYLLVVTRAGFSEAARTLPLEAAETVDAPVTLEIGFTAAVTVTAARSERELRQVPLHIDTITASAVEQMNTLSTGDAIAATSNVTPVGGGPVGVRPRLRGLDSTRLLVLVDGERLNTARMATDRTGAEVALVSPDAVERIEIVNGAGTLMYGSDALAGTINVITNEPSLTPDTRLLYGFQGYYSSNENGLRGTLSLGATSPRVAFRVQGGAERFDPYRAGDFDVENTDQFFRSGQIRRTDTIDDAFGLGLRSFPDPFNAPYVRTDGEIPNSQARGNFVNASAQISVGERRTVRVRYQRRRLTDVGFPDFASPYFFNAVSLPFNRLDKISARYEARAVTPWLANLSLTTYYQQHERQLQNLLPVQFPAPAATFFPISVMRLDILSKTTQRVGTPGMDLQAVFVPASRHLLTTGITWYLDRSRDDRTTETTTSMVGQVIVGPRGPAPVVFPQPLRLGPPALAHPVRVPEAGFRDIAVFAQDEWRAWPEVSIVAGLRTDLYRVNVDATPGYTVAPVVAGARPAIDPATLPPAGDARYSRNAVTGDVGLVAYSNRAVSPFVRFGRSYRHPNLEEMLYAGPATAGSIAPNVRVKPEIGNNVDAGAKFRRGTLRGGAFVFFNRYQDFIAQDLVVATTPAGPLAQATNFADVRIAGVELSADAPVVLPGNHVLTLSGDAAFTHGTVVEGVNPVTGRPLNGTPADNITPSRALVTARFTERGGRWWTEYGVRAQGAVSRVAVTMLETPFLIPQDLLSLDGFAVQRAAFGIMLTRARDRAGIVFAVENLTDRFYREHFQFAPSRGRSFTVGLTVGAF
jgi:outer membrane receptor protein involved in Fe transport